MFSVLGKLIDNFLGLKIEASVPKKTSLPKKASVPKKVRDNVWIKYHGTNITGICYSCGCNINRYNAGWHVAHVKARAKGGKDTVSNLRTCCPGCNLSCGDMDLYDFIKKKNLNGPGRLNCK